jgi:FixJ family two-component response regulator
MSRSATASPDIFVVDDDPEVGHALGRFLRSAGYAVESFGSAEAFLALHPAPASGLLIVDVRMPGMSGPELQRDLIRRGATIPMLFISAVDDAHVRDLVIAAGAAGWLRKPVDGEDLLARVSALRPGREHSGG